MKYLVSSTIVAVLLGGLYGIGAQSTEITLVAPGGFRASAEQLIPGFERASGKKVKATYRQGIAIKKQIAEGEAFDVPVLQAPYPEVVASGNLVNDSEKVLVSIPVGIAVRKGAPKPDISSAAAIKKMLLAASSVAFPDPKGGATAGISFDDALKSLGIEDQMMPKFKLARGGPAAMAMVAKGDAEIGATFMSEMEDPGIEIVGALPRDVCPPTVLAGFITAKAKDPAGAKALLDYLSGPEAAAVYKANRMVPGR